MIQRLDQDVQRKFDNVSLTLSLFGLRPCDQSLRKCFYPGFYSPRPAEFKIHEQTLSQEETSVHLSAKQNQVASVISGRLQQQAQI